MKLLCLFRSHYRLWSSLIIKSSGSSSWIQSGNWNESHIAETSYFLFKIFCKWIFYCSERASWKPCFVSWFSEKGFRSCSSQLRWLIKCSLILASFRSLNRVCIWFIKWVQLMATLGKELYSLTTAFKLHHIKEYWNGW